MSPIMKSLLLAVSVAVTGLSAHAADDASCKKVRFVDVGWSDIAATTGMATVVMEALGYNPTVTIASIPIAFAGMKNKQIDVFLGYWNPSMTPVIEPFIKDGQIKVLDKPNLVGAKYTLAVPTYLYDKGLKSFADISKFQKELNGKIYGIEPGNDGNRMIQTMIDKNAFGLKDAGFKVVESSEAGMLSQVDRAQRRGTEVVFLGWEPHPMNTRFKMKYLTGGDEFFGPNYGQATIYTNTRKGYTEECSNVGQLLKNLVFTLDMESTLMGKVLDDKIKPDAAAKAWLKQNPQVLESWLAGVTTVDGKPGLEAVKASLAK